MFENVIERKELKNIPYAFAIRSLMYTHVCNRLDIAYALEMLGIYQFNPSMNH